MEQEKEQSDLSAVFACFADDLEMRVEDRKNKISFNSPNLRAVLVHLVKISLTESEANQPKVNDSP